MKSIDIQCNAVLKEKYNKVGVPDFHLFLPEHLIKTRMFAAKMLAMSAGTYLCDDYFPFRKNR